MKSKNTIDFYLKRGVSKNEIPKNRTDTLIHEEGGVSPILMEYNGISLIKPEYLLLKKLEKLFGAKIPFKPAILSEKWINNPPTYSFFAKNNHIEHLHLINFNFRRFCTISTFPEGISQLYSLKAFSIGLTKLTLIPIEFYELTNLEYLNLSYNRIKKISKTIGQFKKLKILKLNNNELKNIPSTLFAILCLEHLDLRNNLLSGLPQNDVVPNPLNSRIPSPLQLKQLFLSNNKIKKIPDCIQEFSSLSTLDLSKNHISHNESHIMRFPPSLKHFYLSNNPICNIFYNGTIPSIFIELAHRCWIYFGLNHKFVLNKFPITYCPIHEKRLIADIIFINKIQGLFKYTYRCPEKTCVYEKEVPSHIQKEIWDAHQSHHKQTNEGIKKDTIFFDNKICPPHEIIYEQVLNRYVGFCLVCGKSEKEIMEE